MKLIKRLTAAFLTAAVAVSAAFPISAAAQAEIYSVTAKKIPSNSATAFVADMGAGWNLGNAFDAANCTWLTNEMDYESAWNGAKTTKKLISAIKAKGFNTIRIPVSWSDHVDKNYTISSQWLERVKEVVDWCMDENLYVIINIHHDIEKGYYYPSSSQYATSEKYVKTIWTQLAKAFASYDEKLIFESVNEPRPAGTSSEWWYNSSNPGETALDAFDCINKLNQVFVDTVRAQGENNKTRYLMVPGFATSTEGLTDGYFTLPEDTVSDKLIVTAHIYTVKSSEYVSKLDKLYNSFVSKGIPVVIGEFGSTPTTSESTRIEAAGKTCAEAKARGISCIWWDNNSFKSDSDGYGLINRSDAVWKYSSIADAIVANSISKSSGKTASSSKTSSPSSTSSSASSSKTASSSSKADSSSTTSASVSSAASGLAAPTAKAAAGDGKIKLSWTSVNGANYYKIYQYDPVTKKYKSIGKVTKTSCTVSGVTNGKTYYFLVRACSDNGEASPCYAKNVVSATPKA